MIFKSIECFTVELFGGSLVLTLKCHASINFHLITQPLHFTLNINKNSRFHSLSSAFSFLLYRLMLCSLTKLFEMTNNPSFLPNNLIFQASIRLMNLLNNGIHIQNNIIDVV